MSQQVRIRDNGTVIEHNFPKDKLEKLQKVATTKTMTDYTSALQSEN